MSFSRPQPSNSGSQSCRPLSKVSTSACASSSSRPSTGLRSRFASRTHQPINITNVGDHEIMHEDKDDLDIGQTSYLDKDAALQKINEELEKKSLEIFRKIELYSNRSHKIFMSEAGDAPLAPNEKIHSSAPTSIRAMSAQKVENFKPKGLDFDAESIASYDSNSNSNHSNHHGETESSTYSNVKGVKKYDEDFYDIMSPNESKSSKSNGNRNRPPPSPDTKDVDLKARKRLQKATESVVKCLQSKLISYEGRLADLHVQFRQKIQENTMLESKIRALEDDREKLLKNMSNLQSAADKSTKAAEVAKSNLSLKIQTIATLKKDMDTMKREQKQRISTTQTLQTRLNRCNEENEKLKQQNRTVQMAMRDKQQDDRAQIDDLQQRIGQLEQQKSILNATVAKQSALIKTLRNQRLTQHDRSLDGFY